MKLSNDFWLSEFTKSDTAIRNNIANTPSPGHLSNLRNLCAKVLQPARDNFGRINVTSGYRSPVLNRLVNGSNNSQHSKGEAADIEADAEDVSNLDLARWIAKNVEFDQLILEHWDGQDPKSGWVHVSCKQAGNRREIRRAHYNAQGKVVYPFVDLEAIK